MMLFISLILGIALLIFLIVVVKLNSFISLLIAAVFVGLAEGLPILEVLTSVQNGIGGTLGHLAIIISFGAMLGKLLTESGGAQRISETLIAKLGRKRADIAICIASFIIGITLFFEVAFVLLIPIVFSLARSQKIPLLKLGMPMAASMAIAHCFLPPHPGATAVTIILGADMGKTLLYGIIIAIPTVICAGIYSYRIFLKNMHVDIPDNAFSTSKIFKRDEMPSFAESLATALIPIILIGTASIVKAIVQEGCLLYQIVEFVGNPDIALFIALCFAVYFLGIKRGKSFVDVMKTCESSIASIAMIMLIIGAGGAFKQVILDTGLGEKIAEILITLPLSTYLLTFIMGAIVKVAVGSSTVSSLTTAGLVAPLVASSGVSPEITVLVIGASSMMIGPPHDGGFWIYKEFFGLTMKQGMKSWCVICNITGIVGFSSVMLLNFILTSL